MFVQRLSRACLNNAPISRLTRKVKTRPNQGGLICAEQHVVFSLVYNIFDFVYI
jgi:hypothetical protein